MRTLTRLPMLLVLQALIAAGAMAQGQPAVVARSPTAIEGRWITSDEGRDRAVVEIVGDGDAYTGRVVQLFLRDDEPPKPRCERCPGDARDRPIRGLAILHVTASSDGHQYEGTVLDPEEARRYRCIVHVDGSSNTLTLRGYVGVPVLGRTETWKRAPQR